MTINLEKAKMLARKFCRYINKGKVVKEYGNKRQSQYFPELQ